MQKQLRTSRWILVLIAGLLPLACSKQNGFESSSSQCLEASCSEDINGGNGNRDDDNNNNDNIDEQPQLDLSQLEGKVNGGSYDQLLAFKLDKVNNTITLIVPLGINYYVGSMSGEISQLPGASYRVEIDVNSGQAYFKLTLPIKYLVKGAQFTDHTSTLPNGDPLPMIPDGEMTSTSIAFQQSQNIASQIYLAPSVLGVFVATPFNPYISLTMPIKNKAKTKILGYLSLVPEKNNFKGGFFMSFVLPPEFAKYLEQNL